GHGYLRSTRPDCHEVGSTHVLHGRSYRVFRGGSRHCGGAPTSACTTPPRPLRWPLCSAEPAVALSRDTVADEMTLDGATLTEADRDESVARLLDVVDGIDSDGWYPRIEVQRPWS